MFAQAQGDISDLLTDAELTELGVKAVREWHIDAARGPTGWSAPNRGAGHCRAGAWRGRPARTGMDDGAANIYSPLLTLGSLSFAAKASPDLIRGDQVVGIKVFQPPAQPQPNPGPPPQPQNPQEAAQLQQAMAQAAAGATAAGRASPKCRGGQERARRAGEVRI